jgi:nicotinate-nucleotide adenylyltransferase
VATGLLGGSFDPVHHGHLIAAERAAEALGLAQVVLVPCARQPLKRQGPVAAPEHRRAMLELAYTVDTLRALHARHPGERFVLLLGADAASDLPRWRSADEVARLAEVAILTRPGAPEVRNPLVRHVVATPAIEISASDIRARCLAGKSIRYLVPDAVADYIEREHLYR